MNPFFEGDLNTNPSPSPCTCRNVLKVAVAFFFNFARNSSLPFPQFLLSSVSRTSKKKTVYERELLFDLTLRQRNREWFGMLRSCLKATYWLTQSVVPIGSWKIFASCTRVTVCGCSVCCSRIYWLAAGQFSAFLKL